MCETLPVQHMCIQAEPLASNLYHSRQTCNTSVPRVIQVYFMQYHSEDGQKSFYVSSNGKFSL